MTWFWLTGRMYMYVSYVLILYITKNDRININEQFTDCDATDVYPIKHNCVVK